MTALIFLRLDLVSHISPCLKRSSGRSSSCVRYISQRSFGPWYALQNSRTSCAGTIWSKLLKMKRTGKWAFNFFSTLRQSMANRSKPSSQLARCSTRYSKGLKSILGSCTFFSAILWITPLRHRKGESRTSAATSQAYALANMSAQRLPILLPHSVTLATRTCRRTYSNISLMSKTSLTPQLNCPASLFPHPSKSNAAKLHPNCATSSARGSASNLEPPLPWRQSMVSAASACGQWKRNPSNFFPLRLRTDISRRTTVSSPTRRSLGPRAAILQRICGGDMMLRQAYSKMFILPAIQIRVQGLSQREIQLIDQIGKEAAVDQECYSNCEQFQSEYSYKMNQAQNLLDNNMASVRKDPLDTSISHYFAPNSSYNVPPTPSRSPTKVSARMYDIKAVPRYYGIDRPILSATKKRLIEEKLALDEKARVELDSRLKEDNLFAKFHRNPFSMKEYYAPSAYQLLEEEQKKKRRGKGGNDRHYMQTTKDTIIRATNELKENDFIRGQSTLTLARSYKKISTDMLRNVSESVLKGVSPKCKPKRAEQSVKAMELDDILSMEDQNFYAANLQNINIFQIMRGTHKPFYTRDTLDKLHFNFYHLVDRIDAVKLPLLRDLSRVGRDLMNERRAGRHNRIDYIHSSEMAVNYGDIRFEDLLSMASGRFNPEIAYTAANQGDVRKDFSPTSSHVSDAEILYDSRVRHKQHNIQNPLQERYEINAYHIIPNTPQEQKIDRLCGHISDKITSDIKLRGHLLKNTIKDKSMHKKIENAVQENISYLANLNNRRKGVPIERLISNNKINKNRKERLQIKHLLQSIQLKNKEEEKIRELLKPRRTAS